MPCVARRAAPRRCLAAAAAGIAVVGSYLPICRGGVSVPWSLGRDQGWVRMGDWMGTRNGTGAGCAKDSRCPSSMSVFNAREGDASKRCPFRLDNLKTGCWARKPRAAVVWRARREKKSNEVPELLKLRSDLAAMLDSDHKRLGQQPPAAKGCGCGDESTPGIGCPHLVGQPLCFRVVYEIGRPHPLHRISRPGSHTSNLSKPGQNFLLINCWAA